MFNSKDKHLEEFAKLLGQMGPVEFVGLAKILCVHIFDNENLDENGKPLPRPAEPIISECIIAFDKLNRSRRREILQVMRRVVKNK